MKMILALMLLLPSIALADVAGPTVLVTFDAPSGVDPALIKGYSIYCATIKGGPYTLAGKLLGATTTTGTVANCFTGTYGSAYFVATTINQVDVESTSFSNEAVRTWAPVIDPPNMAACVPTIVQPVKMTVAPSGTYTTRPLYLDATRSKAIGRIKIGLPCEDETIQATTSGEWRWATNDDPVQIRGIVLCKP
jgi:hypothetical protein